MINEPRRPAFRDYAFSALAIPLIYLYTAVMGTLSLVVSFFDTPRGEQQHRCAQIWSRLIARTVCTRIEVTGLSRLAPGASYVFLSTHQSYMDIPVMLGYLPVQLRVAAKKEVFRVPLLGGHLRRAGHISIDRSSTSEAVATLQRAAGGLDGGLCAFVFPEGTRSRDGSLQPFKKGGFRLAMQAGVPVVPVTIVGTRQLLPRDSIIFRRGPVRMDVGEPIPTAPLRDEDLPELMELVRRSMQARLEVGI